MAQNAEINIKINSSGAVRSVDALNKEFVKGQKETKTIVGQLRALKQELAGLEPGTKRFQELSEEAAILQDRVSDVSSRVRILSSDTLALDQAIGVVQGLGGAYAATQGVMALLGTENDKLLQTMVKLQAIMTTLNGIQQVANALNKDSAAGILLRDTRTKLLNLTLVKQTTATTGATVATRALRVAMMALPILAIVGAITAMVSAFSKMNKEQEEAKKKAEAYAEAQKKIREEQDKANKSIADQSGEFVGLIVQLKATNENSEERLSLMKQINDTYGLTLENLQDEKLFQEQLNLAVSDYIKLQRNKFIQSKNQEEINELLGKQLAIEAKIEEKNKEIDKVFEMRQKRLENVTRRRVSDDLQFTRRIIELQGELEGVNERLLELGVSTLELKQEQDELTNGGTRYEKQNQKTTKSIQNKTKATNDLADANRKFYDALEADRQRNLVGEEKELQDAANRYDRLIELADAAEQDTADITKQYQQEVADITNRFQQERINNQKLLQQELLIIEQEIALQRELNAETDEKKRVAIRKKYNDEIIQLQIDQAVLERDIALENFKGTEEERQKIIQESNLKIAKLMGETTEVIAEETEKTFTELMSQISQITNQVFGQLSGLANAIGESVRQEAEQAREARDRDYEHHAAALENLLAQDLISREEYDVKLSDLNQKREYEERQARREAFYKEKRLSIANASMAMAQAILNALTVQPLVPFGLIMAAIAATTGAKQISTIKAQTFTAARGGVVPGRPSNQDTVPSMLAPGEAVINSTSSAMFPELLSQINQMGGGVSLTPDVPQKTTSTGGSVYETNQQSQRVYVLENDITRSQRRITRIEDISQFG